MPTATAAARLLVTGGAGFLGSALVRRLVATGETDVVTVDALTYAGNLDSLANAHPHPRHHFEQADIGAGGAIRRILDGHRPTAILHLAAESHVDRSIDGPAEFVRTNVVGTATLLDEARRYWNGLTGDAQSRFRFLHVSTDEVFGSLGEAGAFTEASPYRPNSPYAATKAASDHLARSWHRTYGLPCLTTYASNTYGPYQFPEKLIPLMILSAIEGRPLPVYGGGEHVRDWLHVDDQVDTLLAVLRGGRIGETYCIGGRNERRNIDVVHALWHTLDVLAPSAAGPYARLITHVPDRPGHDMRYAIDSSRIENELGWRTAHGFASGLRETVQWYLEHRSWWERVRSGAYRTCEASETDHGYAGERLGLGALAPHGVSSAGADR